MVEDAGVLLVTRVADEITRWPGKELRKADFLFVLFLNDGKGGYRSQILNKFRGYIPAIEFIDIIPAGKIRPRGAKQEIALRDPAIMLTHCGKSAAAYSVIDGRVTEFPLSD